MENTKLKIFALGNRQVPERWHLAHRIKMQRLYYIKGGKGYMKTESGEKIPFENGKIYIHPYNLFADYYSDPQDPIDHVYFDFLSTPPIISDTPLVYDLPEESAARSIVLSVEQFCKQLVACGVISKNMICLTSTNFKKDSPHEKVLYGLLSTLLDILSYEKPLPFSGDAIVLNALDTIRHRYMEPLSVQQLANDANFDVHYFIRRFKQVMGVTPYAYLRNYRLLKAKELIDGGTSLTEACGRVGYESPAALSRALKQDKW